MTLALIEHDLKKLATLDEETCKNFRKRIREALRERKRLPVGIRSQIVINQTFLRMLGQRDLSGLEKVGFVVNLKYGEKVA
ncbi:hypothetical protein MOA67_gp336 [Klebsiella phage KpLz-2_45]|uniref:hypothetical protein n=1 Tax=Klebsiella phage KpLz-2_45 TaxID=2698923 RepID=UPI001F12CE2D|nr:hypothetical protein MOA67_gp336 [Klebsiella phage KpLz-2_45]UKS72087.1 hypothetical protein KpLz245_2210 [Klebsiella phage KpLz-2_45]